MSIKSKIQALITAANTKTGESDTTLTDAVQTLVDGYGQGGGGVETITGEITLQNTDVSILTIPVDVTGKNYIVKINRIESGVVENEQLTIDDGFVCPRGGSSNNSSVFMGGVLISNSLTTLVTYRYNTSVSDESYKMPNNFLYRVAWIGGRGSEYGVITTSDFTSQISLNMGNATRAFCRVGAYSKLRYEVIRW